jgi:hypothetical protein
MMRARWTSIPSFAYAPVGCPAMIGWVMPLAVAVISMKQK